ncbi:MAG TPA: ABC transporter substrate-binding protein, partial [Caldimonas sp.]
MKNRLLSALAGLGLALAGALPASAQTATGQPVKFALCYDLSKAYTFVTPQISQAARDYAEILNQKGGLEGHPIEIIVQDHGNEPQRGIECYEKLKR